MKRPAVFIPYFQSPFQIVQVYQVLHSEYFFFFRKSDGRFNLMSILFTFHQFCEETYEKTYQFYDLFSNFPSLCARSQNFVIWKFLLKKWRLFQNVNNLLFILATLSNICACIQTSHHYVHACKILSSENFYWKNDGSFKMLTIYYSFRQLWAIFVTKLMKRCTIFFNILKLPLYFYMFTKFHDQQIKKKKKAVCFNMWTKSCLLQQLWTIFSTKIMKNSTIFVTYF